MPSAAVTSSDGLQPFRDDAQTNAQVDASTISSLRFVDPAGQDIDLAQYRGKSNVVLVVTRGLQQAPAAYGAYGSGSGYGGYPAGSRPGYYEPADRIGGPMGGPDYRPMTRGYGEPIYEPEVVYESYQYCTSCNQRVSDSASVGQRCPHCGVLWTSGAGSSSLASGSGGSSIPAFTLQGARIGRIVGVVVALVLSLFGYAVRQSMRGGSPPAQVRKAPSAAPNFAGFTPEQPSPGSTGEHSITEIRRRLRPGNGGQS